MRVHLVNPPSPGRKAYIREGRCMQATSSWAALWMPLTLATAAAHLRARGHEVRVLDCVAERRPLAGLAAGVGEPRPDLLVLNTALPTLEADLRAAAELKRSFPGVPVAAVGLCATILGEELLRRGSGVDFAVVGEPEWVLERLAAALEGARPLREVRGLVLREGEGFVSTPAQDLARNDPGDLPLPARDLLPNERYRLPLTGERFTLLSIGRGCPHGCTFCASALYHGRAFRRRPVRSVVGEIAECVDRHGIASFLFWGESFTLDASYAEELCREILARGLRIRWSTTSRVDTLTPGLLRLMKEAGCVLLGLGLESAEQGVLDAARKGTTVRQLEEAVRMVREAGLRSMGHFVFGLPGDTRETAERTVRFALASGIDYAQFYCAVPYPGTALGEHARQRGWVEPGGFERYDLSRSIMRNEALSPREIERLRDSAYRRFYLRPRMLLQALREARGLGALLKSLSFLSWVRTPRETARLRRG